MRNPAVVWTLYIGILTVPLVAFWVAWWLIETRQDREVRRLRKVAARQAAPVTGKKHRKVKA